ncbi:transposase [Streptomyces sp. NPDC012474]|uniref:transposase n=1 Tax=Streptomyces sp. NPDC012474 TaxID=3364836 RepID=UPI0036EE56BD
MLSAWETRLTCRNMVEGLLMVKKSANYWSLGEAIGHGDGPHVLQHFLSRARFDDEAVRRAAADWTVEQLGTRIVMLVVDEAGDEKPSTDAVGAARQYSGALVSAYTWTWLRQDFRSRRSSWCGDRPVREAAA